MWSILFPEEELYTSAHFLEVRPVWRALKGSGLGKASKGGGGTGTPQDGQDNTGLIVGLVFAGVAILLSFAVFLYRRRRAPVHVHPDQLELPRRGASTGSKEEHDAARMIQQQWRNKSPMKSDVQKHKERRENTETPMTVATGSRSRSSRKESKREQQRGSIETPTTAANASRTRHSRRESRRSSGGRYGRESNDSALRENDIFALRDAAQKDPYQPSPTAIPPNRSTNASQSGDDMPKSGASFGAGQKLEGRASGIDGYLQKHDKTARKQKPGKKK